MSSGWSDLSIYESHDVVRDKYKDVHGGDVTAEKAAEIVAFFSQGRQYFEAAAEGGPLVSPLLLYYGVNALARGAILFLNRQAQQCTLKPSHGIEIHGWQQTLSGGIRNIADLSLQIGISGTFAELVQATGNRASVFITTEDFKYKFLEVRGTAQISAPVSVSLRDVMSRMPDLAELYADVMGEPPNVYNVGIRQSANGQRTTIDVFGSYQFAPDEQALRSRVPQLSTISGSPHVEPGDSRPAIRFTLQHPAPAPPDSLPPLRYVGGLTLLIPPFTSSLDLSPVPVSYLFAYALGMLARYFPRQWVALLAGGRGDRVYPLIKEGLRKLQNTFPIDLAAELTRA